MRTEDDLAADLRSGKLTLDDGLKEMAESTDLLVYDAVIVDRATATWDDIESLGSGSSDLYASFMAAGATSEQLDAVGDGVVRLRAAGSTIESVLRANRAKPA